MWRYGNQQGHVPHMDADYNSVAATVIVYLSESGTMAYPHRGCRLSNFQAARSSVTSPSM